jgi:predicted DNA-binding transcriptional regulator AlpA
MHQPNPTEHQLDGVWRNQTPSTDAASKPVRAQLSATPPELLTEREAAAVLGVGVRKFHQLRAEPWLPQAIELGPRALRWSRTELLQALATRAPRRAVQVEPEHFKAARARKAVAA